MVAANLARLGFASVLVDVAGRAGKGVAYSTTDPSHRLNVSAKKMSAWPQEPDHFTSFAARHGVEPDAFARRDTFGEYLSEQLQTAVDTGLVTLICGNVEAVRQTREGVWQATLADGTQLSASILVLATGNAAPAALPQLSEVDGEDIIGVPWRTEVSGQLQDSVRDKLPVLIVGTSLTMIDVVLTLAELGHNGPIYAISRRGLLPRAHHAHGPSNHPAPTLNDLPKTTLGMFRWLRRRVRNEEDWRNAVDALRPVTQPLWRALPVREQRRFLRHVRPWWDVHRHRIPADVATVIDGLIAKNILHVSAARIAGIRKKSSHNYSVDLADRTGSTRTIQVGLFINCTGPLSNYGDDDLLSRMAADGLLQADGLDMGIAVTEGDLIEGLESAYAIGTMTRGTHWEVTAVPDLRLRATQLAARIAEQIMTSPREM